MPLQRYCYDKVAPGMFKNNVGGWVKYSDHAHAVEATRVAVEACLPLIESAEAVKKLREAIGLGPAPTTPQP